MRALTSSSPRRLLVAGAAGLLPVRIDQDAVDGAAGDYGAAAALFSSDSMYEDMALRVQVLSRQETQAYLSRTVMMLPLRPA